MIHTAVGGVKHNSNHFTLDRVLDNFLYFNFFSFFFSEIHRNSAASVRHHLLEFTLPWSQFMSCDNFSYSYSTYIYNYVCVLLCLLLYVQRECVVCTVCVKGNISRVLFINIHVIYIFCFFLRIFSADQSVILNRPWMCSKLTSTHTCIFSILNKTSFKF